MVLLANLLNLKINLIIALFIGLSSSYGQSIVTDSLLVKDEIIAFSQDRNGNIFLGFKGGAITKYSPTLDSILSFSPTKPGDITLLEAWHGFQIFVFTEAFQEFTIFDRFLTQNSNFRLSETTTTYVDICTISGDQNIWIFEENHLQLTKLNLKIGEIENEFSLEFIFNSNDHQITYLKEYQNLVFLIDALSGIYIFDNLGNYLKKINAPGIKHCSFKNEQLYYIVNNEIHAIGLYQANHDVIKIAGTDYLGVLAIEKGFLLVKKNLLIKLLADLH